VAQLIIKAIDEATPVIKGIQKSTKELADNLRPTFQAAKDMGDSLIKIGGAGVVSFGLAVKASADLEDALKNTMTMTGLTGKEFSEMEKTVKKLAQTQAIDLGTNTKNVLESYYYVLSTGAKAGSKGFEELSESSLKLSKVTKLDLSSAVTMIADNTKIWGKSMEETAHTANLLFKGSQMGNTTVGQLAEAMTMAGGAAAALGISMEDTAAILVKMADAGFKGSEAGNALKGIFARLAKPTDEVQAALTALNVQLYDSTGKMKPINAILAEMQAGFEKLSPEARNNALIALAGTEHYAKFASIMKKDVIVSLDEYSKKLQEANTLESGFSETKKTLVFQLAQAKEAFMQVVEVIGSSLMPIITPLIERIKEVAMAIKIWVDQNPELARVMVIIAAAVTALTLVIGTLLTIFGSIGIAITGLITAFGGIVAIIPTLTAAFSAIAPFLAPIAAIIGLIAAAIMTLITAAGALYIAFQNNFLGIKDVAEEAWVKIQEVFALLKQTLLEFWAEIYPELLVIWEDIKKIWNELKPFIDPIIKGIMAIIKTTVMTDLAIILTVIKVFIATLKVILNDIKIVIGAIATFLNAELTKYQTFKANMIAIWENLKKAIKAAIDNITAAINAWTGGVFVKLTEKLNQLLALINRIRGAQTEANNLQSSEGGGEGGTSTGGTSTGTGGTVRGSGDSGFLSNGGGGGGNIIINGPVYGGSSGLRELEDLLHRFNVERSLRGA